MAGTALVDTGFILALLDRHDRWHQACKQAIQRIALPLLTTAPVMTEIFHLTLRDFHTMEPAWRLFDPGIVTLARLEDDDLPEIRSLMTIYADHPMDFTDATLVHIANRESLNLILTIDHDDFETYRLAGNRRFKILPSRSSQRA